MSDELDVDYDTPAVLPDDDDQGGQLPMEPPIYFIHSSAGLERTHFDTKEAAIAHAETLKKFVAYRDIAIGIVEAHASSISENTKVAVL